MGVKWIKITSDIFEDEKMLAIETMQDGYLMELVWFKILCLAGKSNCNGFLCINNKIAYTDELLANVFRMDIGTVQRALLLFQDLDMIELVENTYMISNWLLYQHEKGLEEIRKANAERQARFRSRQKQKKIESNVTDNVTVTSENNVIYSYSYSISNSNIVNYINIINNKELLNNTNYEYINYINNNSILDGTLREWMEYKDQLKPTAKNHYAEKGMTTLLKLVVRNDQEYGTDEVQRVIMEAMSSGYMGIVWNNLRKGKKVDSESIVDKWMNA